MGKAWQRELRCRGAGEAGHMASTARKQTESVLVRGRAFLSPAPLLRSRTPAPVWWHGAALLGGRGLCLPSLFKPPEVSPWWLQIYHKWKKLIKKYYFYIH